MMVIAFSPHAAIAKEGGGKPSPTPTTTSTCPSPTDTTEPWPTNTTEPSPSDSPDPAPPPTASGPDPSASSEPAATETWTDGPCSTEPPWTPPAPGPVDLAVYASATNQGQTYLNVYVSHQGENIAQDIHLTGRLPDIGVPWTTDYWGNQGCSVRGLRLDCYWAQLAPWDSSGVTLTAPLTCQALEGRFSVRSADDPDRRNNRAELSRPDLCATGTDTALFVTSENFEEGLGFRIDAVNLGDNPADGVFVQSSFSDVDYTIRNAESVPECSIEYYEDPWYPEYRYGYLGCEFGTIPAGGSRSVELLAPEIPCSVQYLSVYAQVYSQNDIDEGNNYGQNELFPPQCPGGADLRMFTGHYRRGETIVGFEATLVNNGPADANDTFLNFGLPWAYNWDGEPSTEINWTVTTEDGIVCDEAEGQYTCNLGVFPAGNTTTVVVSTETGTCDYFEFSPYASATNDWNLYNNQEWDYIDPC